MKKRNMLNNVRNKTLITAMAIAVSGLLPAGAALAQGELVAELVAEQGVTVSGKPGETVLVPVDIWIKEFGKGDSAAAVTVTASFEGNQSQQISFAANDFTTVHRVNLQYTIPANETADEVKKRVLLSSTDEEGKDKVVDEDKDEVLIKVIQTRSDSTAPIVTAVPDRDPDFNGWYTNDVTVSFSATDETDGPHVASVNEPVQVTTDGTHSITGTATDHAGNEGKVTTVIQLDKTAPSLSSNTEAKPNTAGWYNQDIRVEFDATDETSGIASKSDSVFLTDDKIYSLDGFAEDVAGNRTAETFEYKVDKTAPEITASPERGPDYGSWYNKPVTVSFDAIDNLSGVTGQIAPIELDEGADQSVTRTATDFAGNTGSVTLDKLNVDWTAPEIFSHIDQKVNEAGWYNKNVTVSFSGEDALSKLDDEKTSVPVILTEGRNQSAEGSVTDNAGNVASTKVDGLNIDTTAPVVTAVPDRDANDSGWYNDDVRVEFRANDGDLSGVASVSEPILLTKEEKYSITGTATDVAGNIGTDTFNFNIDKTVPTLKYELSQEPNELGWNNEEVTVSFIADDNLSGIADFSDPVTLTEGTGQIVSGYAVDNADNETSIVTKELNIDTTDPVLVLPSKLSFTLNEKAAWSAFDALSGLASEASGAFDTSKVGSFEKVIRVADKAGNVVEKTINYTVAYDYSGVLNPISNEGDSVFKAGRTIPVKFQLKDVNGAFVADATASIKYVKVSSSVNGEEVDAVSTSAATTGNLFRYDSAEDQYIFNLNTKGLSSGTYKLVIYLNDGSSHVIAIGLK